jgi:hypothetical protein
MPNPTGWKSKQWVGTPGEWCVPVLISVEASSKIEAETKVMDSITPYGAAIITGDAFPRKEEFNDHAQEAEKQ